MVVQSHQFYSSMRTCYRKARFILRETAEKKANEIRWNDGKKDGEKLYAYGCTRCGGYHLTKNPDVPSVI